ncbi:MAG: DUF1931 family protein, partial [Pseudonocardiales bacterium]|nr:DUF1931 family protein [Pseudonocardiales bacterium]
MSRPLGVPVFERFFRSVASIQIDKNDVRRFHDFVDQMIDDIAIAGRNSARWNGRDVIAPQGLPITKGIQDRMREFDKLDELEERRQGRRAGRAAGEPGDRRAAAGCAAGLVVAGVSTTRTGKPWRHPYSRGAPHGAPQRRHDQGRQRQRSVVAGAHSRSAWWHPVIHSCRTDGGEQLAAQGVAQWSAVRVDDRWGNELDVARADEDLPASAM